MKLSLRPVVWPCMVTTTSHVPFRCCTLFTQSPKLYQKLIKELTQAAPKTWESLTINSALDNPSSSITRTPPDRLNKRWMEYQGMKNWEGLLDPLDENLRGEIIRYGNFVEAAYHSFDFDPSSSSYGACKYPKNSLLDRSGHSTTGYRVTKNLRATSGIQLPRWLEKAPSWVGTQSSWIGYVAVCHDKKEINRLGRRDMVIALRGTATLLEWLENLRATLTNLPNIAGNSEMSLDHFTPMVESGFLSLYTSRTPNNRSLQDLVREEIARILQSYGDKPLSLTITGHSLGAALATLAAYDIKNKFKHPLVTVVSFGGPRVGNRSFRHHLDKQDTKVLRIVNSDDLITKVPGFFISIDNDRMLNNPDIYIHNLPNWIQKWVEDTQWVYADVGRALRLRSRDSPYLTDINVATSHDLKTYLHLVNGFVSSTCPFRVTARRMMNKAAI